MLSTCFCIQTPRTRNDRHFIIESNARTSNRRTTLTTILHSHFLIHCAANFKSGTMKIITLVLASLLALPKSHAKRVGAAVRVPPSAPKETWPHKEDDTYWSRLLQADGSMSLPVPTSPPPTPPPVPVPTPPPTPSPTTPDEECIVDVSTFEARGQQPNRTV